MPSNKSLFDPLPEKKPKISPLPPPKTPKESKKKKEDLKDYWYELEEQILNEFEYKGFSVFEQLGKWWLEFDNADDDDDIIVLEDPEEKIKFKSTSELLKLGITEEELAGLKRLIDEDNTPELEG